MITCPVCAGSFSTVSVFLSNVRLVHASESGFQMLCGLQGCHRTFKSFYTYRNHVYSFHDQNTLESLHNPENLDRMERENSFEPTTMESEAANEIITTSTDTNAAPTLVHRNSIEGIQ